MQQEEQQKPGVAQLQQEILAMQGFRPDANKTGKLRLGLNMIESAFPNKVFPVAAVHEFLSYAREMRQPLTDSWRHCWEN